MLDLLDPESTTDANKKSPFEGKPASKFENCPFFENGFEKRLTKLGYDSFRLLTFTILLLACQAKSKGFVVTAGSYPKGAFPEVSGRCRAVLGPRTSWTHGENINVSAGSGRGGLDDRLSSQICLKHVQGLQRLAETNGFPSGLEQPLDLGAHFLVQKVDWGKANVPRASRPWNKKNTGKMPVPRALLGFY